MLDSLFCEDVEVSICIMVWRSLGVMRLGVNGSEMSLSQCNIM
jgi:hypothetical protein